MSTPIRVVLVDDQQLVRVGFRHILESEADIEVVGEAGDGAEALEVVRWRRPDVVLMDIQMPVMDGLEATRRLLEPAGAAPHVIILTTFELDEYVFEALRAGRQRVPGQERATGGARDGDPERRGRRRPPVAGRHGARHRCLRPPPGG